MSAFEDAPLVAIIGRPNVGKSTLFNRLVGSRTAIVEDKPGVTRDRLYGTAEWLGRHFLVVDTGGIDPSLETGLPGHIQLQADMAIDEADLILFVVDALEDMSAVDFDIAEHLRKSAKPILVVANKADNPKREIEATAMHELAVGKGYAISAAHGRGVAELCDGILEALPRTEEEALEAIPKGTRLAFLGRPNAGKSTLINTLMNESRLIVDDVPGTTRDPIYLPFRFNNEDLVLIDTAGLRRRRQVARAMEKLAAIKSIRTMERTHVVILVIDAQQGVSDQDQRIARMAYERGKGVVVFLHKWDTVADDAKLARERQQEAETKLAFLGDPYIVKTSVVGNERDQGAGRAINLDPGLEACLRTARARTKRISTSSLNEGLRLAYEAHQPPMHRGRPVKLYYATQADSEPPFIVISANRGRCLSDAYESYLRNSFANDGVCAVYRFVWLSVEEGGAAGKKRASELLGQRIFENDRNSAGGARFGQDSMFTVLGANSVAVLLSQRHPWWRKRFA